MIKFGAVNIDISHPMNFAWALEQPELNGRAKYVAVYNDGFRGEEEVKAFASKNGLVICKTLETTAFRERAIIGYGRLRLGQKIQYRDNKKPFVTVGK